MLFCGCSYCNTIVSVAVCNDRGLGKSTEKIHCFLLQKQALVHRFNKIHFVKT